MGHLQGEWRERGRRGRGEEGMGVGKDIKERERGGEQRGQQGKCAGEMAVD